MKYKSRAVGSIRIYEFKGRMVGGPEAEKLTQEIKEELATGITKFVFDLSQVNWINSSGLGVLIMALNPITKAKGRLKLAGISEKIESLMMMTRLITIFEIHSNVEEAIAAFSDN